MNILGVELKQPSLFSLATDMVLAIGFAWLIGNIVWEDKFIMWTVFWTALGGFVSISSGASLFEHKERAFLICSLFSILILFIASLTGYLIFEFQIREKN